jgi:hypothetical protein
LLGHEAATAAMLKVFEQEVTPAVSFSLLAFAMFTVARYAAIKQKKQNQHRQFFIRLLTKATKNNSACSPPIAVASSSAGSVGREGSTDSNAAKRTGGRRKKNRDAWNENHEELMKANTEGNDYAVSPSAAPIARPSSMSKEAKAESEREFKIPLKIEGELNTTACNPTLLRSSPLNLISRNGATTFLHQAFLGDSREKCQRD